MLLNHDQNKSHNECKEGHLFPDAPNLESAAVDMAVMIILPERGAPAAFSEGGTEDKGSLLMLHILNY